MVDAHCCVSQRVRHVGWKGPKKVCDVIYPQILDG